MKPFSDSRSSLRRNLIVSAALGACVSVSGCQRKSAGEPPAQPPAPPPPMQAGQTTQPMTAPPATAAPAEPKAEPPLMVKDVGLKTPESVFYDAESDVYLVSNINGALLDADKNGFISKVSPDGKVLELAWIDGTKLKGMSLNAPKGMVVSDGKLFVADINFVKTFDAKTGKPGANYNVPGAKFLNDIAAAPDGTIFVSDSGLKAGKDGLEPTGTDGIYKITKKKGAAEKVLANKELGNPNGLLADADGGVWSVTHGSNDLFYVGKDKKKSEPVKLPKGKLDGLVMTPDGSLLISSWESSAVYYGKPGGSFTVLVENVKSPADIAYDSKRNALVIPLFQSDALQIQKLPASFAKPGPGPTPPPPAAAPAKPGAQPAAPAQPKAGQPAKPAQPAQPAAKPAQPSGAAPAPAPAPAAAQPPPAGKPVQPASMPAQPAQPPAKK